MAQMELIPYEEIVDRQIGVIGTPERDEFEKEVAEALHDYHLGEAIKQERLRHKLTQEELGKRVGVKAAQICKLEHGRNVSVSTMRRVFRALGVASATLDLGASVGKVELW